MERDRANAGRSVALRKHRGSNTGTVVQSTTKEMRMPLYNWSRLGILRCRLLTIGCELADWRILGHNRRNVGGAERHGVSRAELYYLRTRAEEHALYLGEAGRVYPDGTVQAIEL